MTPSSHYPAHWNQPGGPLAEPHAHAIPWEGASTVASYCMIFPMVVSSATRAPQPPRSLGTHPDILLGM